MSYSLYDASVPLFRNMLANLSHFLDKAEAHAAETGGATVDYGQARLAPDMHPFIRQIQMASDAAKGGAGRLAGVAPPSMADDEETFDQLKERIAKTLAFVESLKAEQFAGREDATIELAFPNRTMTFTGRDFLTNFTLPNFLFHVTTAYAVLRNQGVPLGKMDYLAGAQMVPAA